jgi:hypothetical protein
MFLVFHRNSISIFIPANKWQVSNFTTVRSAFLQAISIATAEAYGDLIQPNDPPPVCISRHYFTLTDPITDPNHHAFQTADVILTSLPTGKPLLLTHLNSIHLPSGLTPQQILAKSSSDTPTTQDEIRKALTRDYDTYTAGMAVGTQYTFYSH